MRFHTSEKLGPKQSLTPEGFLVCHDVAIGRTGSQLYSSDELPMLESVGGKITIQRGDADVFHENTLASFEGKPVTIDHPEEEVGPGNWRQLAVGTVQNVRRGEGIDSDLILADLLITDQSGIDAIRRDGIVELSCGYDAEYEQTAPGYGAQRSIIGNHVALVERGRAGPRCSIQDSEKRMQPKPKFLDKLFAVLGVKDADELEKKFDDEEELTDEEKAAKETKDSIAKLTKTVDALTAVVAKLTKDAEPGIEEDDPAKTDDSDEDDEEDKEATADTLLEAEPNPGADVGTVFTGDRYADAVARAEILAPGFKAPTHDSALTAGRFYRQALRAALKTADGAAALAPMLGGRDIKQFTGDSLHAVFIGASEVVKAKNNAIKISAPKYTADAGALSPAARVAQINAAAAAFYSK